jgi:hypothetical protein
LLLAGLFWEKSTAGWWLISQANRAMIKWSIRVYMVCIVLDSQDSKWTMSAPYSGRMGCWIGNFILDMTHICGRVSALREASKSIKHSILYSPSVALSEEYSGSKDLRQVCNVGYSEKLRRVFDIALGEGFLPNSTM